MRLHLFAGHDHYPNGGMEDYRGTFATLEDCLDALPKRYSDMPDPDYGWVQVALDTPAGLVMYAMWSVTTGTWKMVAADGD